MLSKKTIGHQMGSSLDYTEALLALTKAFPEVWSIHVSGKETASSRFQNFVKAGSQGAPAQFWLNVSNIFANISAIDEFTEADQSAKILKALHTGITRKDEHRSNVDAAWDSYFSVAERLAAHLPNDQKTALLNEYVLPPVQEFVKPNPQTASWAIQHSRGLEIISKAQNNSRAAIEKEWPLLADTLAEDVRTSAPEQSKDYESSQRSVEAYGRRFFALQSNLLERDSSKSFEDVSIDSAMRVLEVSMTTLQHRHGKPYGAAGVIAAGLQEIGDRLVLRANFVKSLNQFLAEQLPDLVMSPSQTHLISILYASSKSQEFEHAWNSTIDIVLNTESSADKARALQQLLNPAEVPKDFSLAIKNPDLQSYILQQARQVLAGETEDWTALSDALGSSRVVAESTAEDVLVELTKTLTIQPRVVTALTGLEMVVKRSPEALNRFLKSPKGSDLFQDLLLLSESPKDDIARTASKLEEAMRSIVMQQDGDGSSSEALAAVIERNLYHATPKALPVDILVDLARKVLQSGGDNFGAISSQILPNPEQWETQLSSFLQSAPSSSLSFSSHLGGALCLIEPDTRDSSSDQPVERDNDSYVPVVRMAQYTTYLLTDNSVFNSLEPSKQADYYRLLLLSTQMANDKVTIFDSNQLWLTKDLGVESEMIEFVSRTQGLFTKWYSNIPGTGVSEFMDIALDNLLTNSVETSAQAFYNARAYSQANSEIIETNGWHAKPDSDLEGRLKTLRKSPDVLCFAAFLTGFKLPLSTTQTMVRFCNELVADLTGLKPEQSSSKILKQLVLLNIVLQEDDHVVSTIAKQRIIFFVKHIVPWLELDMEDSSIQVESYKALTFVLPHMNDIYGDHWNNVLERLLALWSQPSGPATLPLSHASLKLFAVLMTLTRDEETSDDLTEAWQENLSGLAKGLINTLKHSGSLSDEGNQPLRIVNELLARQLNRVPLDTLDNIQELFPLLTADSAPVQTTAFEILHRQIPSLQEQISVDVALEKTDAKLPEELLSLVLEAPKVSHQAGKDFDRAVPSALRCYLSSWLLVFDHFKQAVSILVKTRYKAN